jgi:hypothetical protein
MAHGLERVRYGPQVPDRAVDEGYLHGRRVD